MIKLSNLNKNFYKPGEIASLLNISTRTVQNYTKTNKLDLIWTDTGRRLIPKESLINLLDSMNLLYKDTSKYDVIYARVSSHKQKDRGDLDRQINRLVNYSISKNPKDLKIFSDVGSGLNDNRKSLNLLLKEVEQDKIDRIFITYKDRLTRFGFNYLRFICDSHNTEIVVMSDEEKYKSVEEELAEDIIAIIHSFSGKMYGLRRKIKDSIEDD
jgi:predicted site-specific integrase-resolvase